MLSRGLQGGKAEYVVVRTTGSLFGKKIFAIGKYVVSKLAIECVAG